MDKYEHWFAKTMKRLTKVPKENIFGITIGQTTYYSCAAEVVSDRLRKHENCHKKQWKEEGIIKFFMKYMYYQIRYGYLKNPYEVDARKAEGE